MGKRILVINGHPDADSFNFGLSQAYVSGAKASGANIEVINIRELDFNPNLQFGYRKRTELEPDLLDALEKIKQTDHLVWMYPMWWHGPPAILKGFIDRLFLPGIAFEYIEGKPFPKKLLKGKTGRIVITADTPRWYDRLVMRSPAVRQFKKGTLEFCGIKPVGLTYFAPIKGSTDHRRKQMLDKVMELGKKMK